MGLASGAMIDSRRVAQMKNAHNSVHVPSLASDEQRSQNVESILHCGRVSGWR